MIRQVYGIDDYGYIKEILVVDTSEQLVGNIIRVDPPNGLYRAKWTGSEWVEDMTQEEIDALNNVPQLPTAEERLEATESAILALMEVLG